MPACDMDIELAKFTFINKPPCHITWHFQMVLDMLGEEILLDRLQMTTLG